MSGSRPLEAIGATPKSLLLFIFLSRLAVFAASRSEYGFMSDELYFLDASYHPAFGYIDFPPLIAWLFAAVRSLFAESLWVFRVVAAAIGLATILIFVDVCRLLGGGITARWISASILLFAPAVLSIHGLLTMNVLDQFWWASGFWLLIRYLQDRRRSFMWGLGAVLGAGLMTKLSIGALGIGILAATCMLRRDLLRQPETWIAVALAVLISSPYAIWQMQNGFPLLDFIRAYNSTPPASIVLQNPVLGLLITMSPLYALIWLPGSVAILAVDKSITRFLSVTAWAALAVFILGSVKFYFAVPVFMLFSIFGAMFWERWLDRSSALRKTAFITVMVINGIVAVPIAAPVLTGQQLQALVNFLRDAEAGVSMSAPAEIERYFPHFAEMHGWKELVSLTEKIAMSESRRYTERHQLLIVAAHYGQAAAINRLDEGDRLPPAYSGHMSYDLWNGDVVFDSGLFVGFPATQLAKMFQVVEFRGQLNCNLCMQREKQLKVYFVAEPKVSSDEIRRSIRRFHFF